MELLLAPVTRELLDEYYRKFQMDPDLFMDMSLFREYVYSPECVEAYYKKLLSRTDSEPFMILADGEPVGEIAMKHIDAETGTCELSIHLRDDSVKNRGIGTAAEKMLLDKAFRERGMNTVFADAVHKNARSRHVLEKVGFIRTREDETFVYYRFDREKYTI